MATDYSELKEVAMNIWRIHHIGVTVKDMDSSVTFYTEILGGKDVTSEHGYYLKGQALHSALLAHEAAAGQKGVPDLANQHELDVRFIQFPNVVVELLWYHQPHREGVSRSQLKTFDAIRQDTSPAYVGSMHISFEVDPDKDMDQFLASIEAAAAARGFTGVTCNRVDTSRFFEIAGVDETTNQPIYFDGWILAYCKGPNGEQFEFNQVKRHIKTVFDASRAELAAHDRQASG
jgi:catechol 2,3-dioxygenase-like lactoylglutathione lyase family enzyme